MHTKSLPKILAQSWWFDRIRQGQQHNSQEMKSESFFSVITYTNAHTEYEDTGSKWTTSESTAWTS